MARAEASLHVEVAYSPAARQVECVALTLPQTSTVHDALQASGLPQRLGLSADALACGVWGRRCALTQRLNNGDRVEIYRPLSVDPKQARRLRDKAARLRMKQRPAGDERGSGGSGMGR